MIFFALDIAGTIISTEIGLQLPTSLNPMSGAQMNSAGSLLYYLAAMLWLNLDLHHWMLVGLQRTYSFLPVGGAHLSAGLLPDVISRTSQIFLIALQLSAPIMAVSFIISLVFSVLGRAVPQMNVFQESFVFRILIGLSVFGLTMNLMSQHIINFLRRLPEDMSCTWHNCWEPADNDPIQPNERRSSRREDREGLTQKARGGPQ